MMLVITAVFMAGVVVGMVGMAWAIERDRLQDQEESPGQDPPK